MLSREKTLSKLNTIHKDGNIYIPTTQLNSNEPQLSVIIKTQPQESEKLYYRNIKSIYNNINCTQLLIIYSLSDLFLVKSEFPTTHFLL